MRAKQLITDNLLKIIRKLTKEAVDVQVSIPENSENGDYYTNVALRLVHAERSRSAQGKPLNSAYKIKEELEKISDLKPVVGKIEVVSPGFINFFLSKKSLVSSLHKINKEKERFGTSDKLKGQKVMIEFTDPNPFKEFHIGHLYSNIVGEALSRLYESQGAKVWRVCYQGDVGLHVAKAIYGMRKLSNQMPDDSAPLSIRAAFMGRSYVLGSRDYEENKIAKNEIEDLNKKIYQQDSSVHDLYQKGRAWSLDYFGEIYKRLGTSFKKFYFESQVGDAGIALVREFVKKGAAQRGSAPAGVFEKSEGAVIFPGGKYGLHNRVFVNSQGLPTYEAKDLGLAGTKYQDFAYDVSLIITGQEQADYFTVVLAALSQVDARLAAKTSHISHGMVRLPGGKISSRTGEVITGEWLLDEAIERIHKQYPKTDKKTAEKVGVGAIKYALLKNSIGGDIEFNFEESISLEGNSGPYLQYSFVRTKSVIEKNNGARIMNYGENAGDSLNSEELAVLRTLVHFPEVVSEAQLRLSPNLIASYLFDLASKFNLFYQKHPIIEGGKKRDFRLALTSGVGQAIKNGLNLLGIEIVRKM